MGGDHDLLDRGIGLCAMTSIEAKRRALLQLAKLTSDPSVAHWCRVFSANLALVASDDAEKRERGMRMLRTNADWCERLFVAPRRIARG
jgi:hypothetical protein